jgi:hypothetical protein
MSFSLRERAIDALSTLCCHSTDRLLARPPNTKSKVFMRPRIEARHRYRKTLPQPLQYFNIGQRPRNPEPRSFVGERNAEAGGTPETSRRYEYGGVRLGWRRSHGCRLLLRQSIAHAAGEPVAVRSATAMLASPNVDLPCKQRLNFPAAPRVAS